MSLSGSPRHLREDFDPPPKKRRIAWPILCALGLSAGFIGTYIVFQIVIMVSNAL